MKIMAFLLLAGVLHVSGNGYSQVKISLSMKNSTVTEVLGALEARTGHTFFYKLGVFDNERRVDVDVVEKDLMEVLEGVLSPLGLAFQVDDKVVVITPARSAPQERRVVAGTVTDAAKMPMPGVSVRLKGAESTGTSTNTKGEFRLGVPAEGEVVLVLSFVGYRAREVKVTDDKPLVVVMEEEVTQLDEFVVSTGYQQIDKRHLTSAITTLKMEDIDVPGVNRIDAMLEGRIPGLTYMQNTGQVGATPKLRIRGTSSILGNQEPLWVVDGIVQQDPVNVDPQQLNDLDFVNLLGNAISGLNPDDVEQIDVLKDAAATALYGARAANGVIVITTKKGKVGPPTVSYSYTGSFLQRPRYTDRGFYMMNSADRVDLAREMIEKGLNSTFASNGFTESVEWIGYEKAYLDYYKYARINFEEFQRQTKWYETMNTDWLDILSNDTWSNSHSVSLNGGNQGVRYYASLGYANERGNVIGEHNQRYSTSLKLTANYDRFSAQFGFTGSVNDRKYAPTELNVMSYAHTMSRAIPLYGEDGELWFYPKNTPYGYPLFNIIHEMENSSREISQHTASINAQIQYKFSENFRLQGTASYQFNVTDNEDWFDENTFHVARVKGGSNVSNELPFGGVLTTDITQNNGYMLRLQADYGKYLDPERHHFINVMAGYEISSSKYKGETEEHRGYYKNRGKSFPSYDLSTGTVSNYSAFLVWLAKNPIKISESLTNMVSTYMTFTYSFRNRYIFNVNGRADWSNAFGDRSNDKIFPIWSLSGRWNMTEDVLKGVDAVGNLALRFSYGLQGNMLNNQPTRMIINKGNYSTKYDSFVSTIKDYPNPGLKWEKTNSYNVGLDFSLWNDKVNGSLAYYYKKTTDAFLSKRVSTINGVSMYTINAGDVENQGVEIALNFTPINRAVSLNGKRGFVWRIDPQIGQTLNRLINERINKTNNLLQDQITLAELLNGTAHVAGAPLNTFYSFRFDRLNSAGFATFKGLEADNQAELTARYNEMTLVDKKNVWFALLERSGSRMPVLQGGISNYFAYRNFSLSCNLAYSLGNKIRMFKIRSTVAVLTPNVNLRKEFAYRWRRPGDEDHTNVPGLATENGWWFYQSWAPRDSYNFNTAHMYDESDIRVARGDYLRLQSLVFRYTLNDELVKKVGISSAYVSLSGSNLFTLASKKLRGQNPEQFGATDIVNISVRPSYSASLNINF
ncbi:MAG: SusC/RagA family TonB-linked outer membrane protein [Odoribacteraceae bacterium]|nr:SusC/RagA family TonB-linked outer membrane protein [Odoribacteraceae bacterium]